MIFEVGRWKVKKENSEKHLEILQESIDFQKKNSSKFIYLKSQFYSVLSEDPEIEVWAYIDEYQDKETFQKWHKEAYLVEIEMAEILKAWEALIIPDSFTVEILVGNPHLSVVK